MGLYAFLIPCIVYHLFDVTVNSTGYTTLNNWMIVVDASERKCSWSNLRYCPGICLEELKKSMKKPQSRQAVPQPRFELGTS
jgi:hypothetical protein